MDAEQAAARVESVSGEAPQRLVDHVVVDTETHVFVRCWPIETSPQMALTDPFTRTEHSGALLVAEMDRAGVDVAILIGYDGYDFAQFMTRFGSVPADFMGGRGYTRGWAERFPERLRYVTTLREPRLSGSDERLAGELDGGAVGVKIFPVYPGLDSDAPEIRAAFDVLSDRGKDGVVGRLAVSVRRLPAQAGGVQRAVAFRADRLGTDWPWFEGVAKYPPLLEAVVGHATFFAAEDRRGYLRGNALRHWGSLSGARGGSAARTTSSFGRSSRPPGSTSGWISGGAIPRRHG